MPQKSSRSRRPIPIPRKAAASPELIEIVDPRWLLKALFAVLLLALVGAWSVVCALFAWGQWQFVLHPRQTVSRRPADLKLEAQAIHFGVDASGQPQLFGWWIPAAAALLDRQAPVVLLLHSGEGNLTDALPRAADLHALGLGVLLFDYRGFGQSGGGPPSETQMQEDTETAFRLLTNTLRINAARIILYGIGLGSSLAVRSAGQHPTVPAVITEDADGDTLSRVLRDPRTRILPASWLFHERFPLADPLRRLKTPKLLLSWQSIRSQQIAPVPPVVAEQAADPKMTVQIAAGDESALRLTIRRFLNTYVPHAPSTPVPNARTTP